MKGTLLIYYKILMLCLFCLQFFLFLIQIYLTNRTDHLSRLVHSYAVLSLFCTESYICEGVWCGVSFKKKSLIGIYSAVWKYCPLLDIIQQLAQSDLNYFNMIKTICALNQIIETRDVYHMCTFTLNAEIFCGHPGHFRMKSSKCIDRIREIYEEKSLRWHILPHGGATNTLAVVNAFASLPCPCCFLYLRSMYSLPGLFSQTVFVLPRSTVILLCM